MTDSVKDNKEQIPRVVFVSNYINHHQIPFCSAMYGLLEGDFAFIQTEKMEEERIRMGWEADVALPYLRLYYEEDALCRRWIAGSETVLFGGTDEESYIAGRLKAGRPVIRYSERLYKEGQWKAVSPRGLWKKYHDHTCYRKKDVYLLCAGAYVPSDFHIIRAYPGKMLKWGYFPETRIYDVDSLMAGKQPGRILWAARFLDWKHPELALQCAKWLKKRGDAFHMDIVGDGSLRPMVEALRKEYQLEDCVTLRGYCPPAKVRNLMEEADIFLATSDRKEGWGAVVNEAMNSGCAVVGSHRMGAVPFLIRHGENGFLYRDGRKEMLFALTHRLLENRSLCQRLGRNAIQTILGEWNGEEAARRLLCFCIRQGILHGTERMKEAVAYGRGGDRAPESGPCSPAEVISEHAMFSRLVGEGEYNG